MNQRSYLEQKQGWNPELIERYMTEVGNQLTITDSAQLDEKAESYLVKIVDENLSKMTRREGSALLQAMLNANFDQLDERYCTPAGRILRHILSETGTRPYHDNDIEYYATADRMARWSLNRIRSIVMSYILEH